MGNEIHKLVNVTIDYPDNEMFTFWDFMCGKVRKISLHAEVIEIPAELAGDYINDPENRKTVQQWVNRIWQEKDDRLTGTINEKIDYAMERKSAN